MLRQEYTAHSSRAQVSKYPIASQEIALTLSCQQILLLPRRNQSLRHQIVGQCFGGILQVASGYRLRQATGFDEPTLLYDCQEFLYSQLVHRTLSCNPVANEPGLFTTCGKQQAIGEDAPDVAKAMSQLDVILYTRTGCHLCDDALAILRRHGLEPELVDIDQCADKLSQFNECVPVVEIDGKVYFRGRVNEILLRRIIKAQNDADRA
jgi:glutaredoxin